MEKPQKIFHVISFTQEYIEAWTQRMEEDNILSKMTRPELIEYRKKNPFVPDFKWYIGKAYRGCWLDKDEIIQLIKDNSGNFSEYYYKYLLIETRIIGELDDWHGSGDDCESWFELNYIPENDSYVYESIKKPECFIVTTSFT
jgi:hypothetical protein